MTTLSLSDPILESCHPELDLFSGTRREIIQEMVRRLDGHPAVRDLRLAFRALAEGVHELLTGSSAGVVETMRQLPWWAVLAMPVVGEAIVSPLGDLLDSAAKSDLLLAVSQTAAKKR